MLRGYACQFRTDETGGGTIMGLLWFILLVGITVLMVDTINSLRIRTMLQATADADTAALGGTNDLSAAAVTSAVAFSAGNMPAALYGSGSGTGSSPNVPGPPASEADYGFNGSAEPAGPNLTENEERDLISRGWL